MLRIFFFDVNRANKRQLMYNELYTPVFEKEKVQDPSQRFIFQLLETTRKNRDANGLYPYKFNKKTRSTMKKKRF